MPFSVPEVNEVSENLSRIPPVTSSHFTCIPSPTHCYGSVHVGADSFTVGSTNISDDFRSRGQLLQEIKCMAANVETQDFAGGGPYNCFMGKTQMTGTPEEPLVSQGLWSCPVASADANHFGYHEGSDITVTGASSAGGYIIPTSQYVLNAYETLTDSASTPFSSLLDSQHSSPDVYTMATNSLQLVDDQMHPQHMENQDQQERTHSYSYHLHQLSPPAQLGQCELLQLTDRISHEQNVVTEPHREDSMTEAALQYTCTLCHLPFVNVTELQQHIKAHDESRNKMSSFEMVKDAGRCTGTVVTQPLKRSLRLQLAGRQPPYKYYREKSGKKADSTDPNDAGQECIVNKHLPSKASEKQRKVLKKSFKCSTCGNCYTQSKTLKIHQYSHTGEKPYKCNACSASFSDSSLLRTHRRKHTGEKPYKCHVCSRQFRLLSTMKSHYLTHTEQKPFVCETCNKCFRQKAALRRHKQRHFVIKPWKCDMCEHIPSSKETLQKHLLLHEKRSQNTCRICGQEFSHPSKLECHVLLHSGDDRPFKCNKCPSAFTKTKYLRQHKTRVHGQKSVAHCEECDITFKRYQSYRAHLRIHSRNGKHICDICGASFTQKVTLSKHKEKVHLKINVKSNSSAASLLNVKLDMYNGTLEPVHNKYICEECNLVFFRLRQLKAHKGCCSLRDGDKDWVQDIKGVETVSKTEVGEKVTSIKCGSEVITSTIEGDFTGSYKYGGSFSVS